MERAITAKEAGAPNNAAGIACIFFIYAYSPCYCLALNTLTYTYLVELWPYAERSRGIAIFQLFARCAEFFTTFVNPVGLANINWKYLLTYCCFLAFEVIFVYFLFPETFGRTLEEVTFMFESKEITDKAELAVEKSMKRDNVLGDTANATIVKTEIKEV